MANEEQLSILKQGVDVWNRWRAENPLVPIELSEIELGNAELAHINLSGADLTKSNFFGAHLARANLCDTNLDESILSVADLREAEIKDASLVVADLTLANLYKADLSRSNCRDASFINVNLHGANLYRTNLEGAVLNSTNLNLAKLEETNCTNTEMGRTMFGNNDLSKVIGLESIKHLAPSALGFDTINLANGRLSEVFLRGCGLSDWEIEQAKLSKPDLTNAEINQILYKIYDLRATRALQISPLFISYSHGDREFVDTIDRCLTEKGIRFWRDIHDLKAGRMERQIDQAISQDRTVLLVLSEHSLKSDWVEHEVRKAREIARNAGRDTLCPVALDDSWKKSPWPARVMEQIMEYNILDFSEWQDDVKFEGMFRKLIDGLELFYKG